MIKTRFGHTDMEGSYSNLKADFAVIVDAMIDLMTEEIEMTEAEAHAEIDDLVNLAKREFKPSGKSENDAGAELVEILEGIISAIKGEKDEADD